MSAKNDRVIKYGCLVLGVVLLGLTAHFATGGYNRIAVSRIVQVKDCRIHPENEDKIVMMTGKLTFEGVTQDVQTGVRVKAPVLHRIVQMAQYDKENTEKSNRIETLWTEEQLPQFTFNGKTYKNPAFPLRSRDFVSPVTFNDGNLSISSAFVKKLFMEKYEGFSQSYAKNMKAVVKIPEKNLEKGFESKGHMLYKKAYEKNVIGDLRIFYKGFSLKDLPEFTVIGRQEEGQVTAYDQVSKIYDRVVTAEDLIKEERPEGKFAALGTACLAIIFLLLGFTRVIEEE